MNMRQNVICLSRTDAKVNMKNGRDVWYHELVASQRPYCPPVTMDSEDTLFMLYTSGTFR